MAKMPQLFSNAERKEKTLRKENSRLKKLVGELTLELKNSTSGQNEETRVGSR